MSFKVPTPFAAACDTVIGNTYGTTGSLTRADLTPMTPTQLKALYSSAAGAISGGLGWNEMKDYFAHQFEMRMCGIPRGGFYEFMMSSNRSGMSALMNMEHQDRGPSLIKPFILGRQLSVVNTESWAILGGYANSEYTEEVTGPLTTSTLGDVNTNRRVIRVGYPAWHSTGFDNDPKWFPPRQRIFILNSTLGAAALGQWKVIEAACPEDKSYVDILIETENGFGATTVDLTPTIGLVLIGLNNVNDYESYLENRANYNPQKRVPFWYQTYRSGRETSSAYLELQAKLVADNDYFEQFVNLPDAERKRQDEYEVRREFVHSALFGLPISANQTLNLWGNLEQITSVSGATIDPGTGGELMAMRANMIGLYPQMKICGRVKDLQNQALNIPEWIELNYDLFRTRSAQGGKRTVKEIPWYCGRKIANLVEIGIINYFKEKYSTDTMRINVESGTNSFGFDWKRFTGIPNLPCDIALVQEQTFSDMEASFENLPNATAADKARGNYLLALDIGKGASQYPAVLGSNRRVWSIGDLEKLAAVDITFAKAMANPKRDLVMNSQCVTMIDECPKASAWMEGIGLITPSVVADTSAPYDPEDLYSA